MDSSKGSVGAGIVPDQPEREREIPLGFDITDRELCNLKESLDRLEQRLTPYMRDNPPQKETTETSPTAEAQTPAGIKLENIGCGVRHARIWVCQIISRLEL